MKLLVYSAKEFEIESLNNANEEKYKLAIASLEDTVEPVVVYEESQISMANCAIAYMKAQIRNFCDNPQEWKIINSVYGSRDLIVREETVYRDLENEFLRDRYIKLITDDIITPSELNLIYLKFVEDTKMQTLVEIYGKSAHLIRKQISSIVKRIKTNLCARNLEEE